MESISQLSLIKIHQENSFQSSPLDIQICQHEEGLYEKHLYTAMEQTLTN